jgi:capsular polysaccharide transport system ATP-binding protein
MIILRQVTKSEKGGAEILSGVSMEIPSGRRIAVFSSQPAQTKTFVQLLSGMASPDSGSVTRSGRISFSIGNMAGFDAQMSVRGNVEHVARLYGADPEAVVDLCRELTAFNQAFDRPFSGLAGEQKARLNLILAYSIPFDLYLHESDLTSRNARKRMGVDVLSLIEARLENAGLVIPSGNLAEACEVCDTAMLLVHGKLYLVDDVRDADRVFREVAGRDADREQLKRYFGIKS